MNQDRAVRLEILGGEYWLLFSGEAMFELMPPGAQFDYKAFIDGILDQSPDGYAALCHTVHVLAEKGELARRDWGYDRGSTPTEDNIRSGAMPYDVIAMRAAVVEAVGRGLLREVPNADKRDTDVGLARLNKKKEEIS